MRAKRRLPRISPSLIHSLSPRLSRYEEKRDDNTREIRPRFANFVFATSNGSSHPSLPPCLPLSSPRRLRFVRPLPNPPALNRLFPAFSCTDCADNY